MYCIVYFTLTWKLSFALSIRVTQPDPQTHPLISHLNKVSEQLINHKVCTFFFLQNPAVQAQSSTWLWNQTPAFGPSWPICNICPTPHIFILSSPAPFKVPWTKNSSHVRSSVRLCSGEKPGFPSSSYSALSAQCGRSASTHAAHASSATSSEPQTHRDRFLWSRPPSKNRKRASSPTSPRMFTSLDPHFGSHSCTFAFNPVRHPEYVNIIAFTLKE